MIIICLSNFHFIISGDLTCEKPLWVIDRVACNPGVTFLLKTKLAGHFASGSICRRWVYSCLMSFDKEHCSCQCSLSTTSGLQVDAKILPRRDISTRKSETRSALVLRSHVSCLVSVATRRYSCAFKQVAAFVCCWIQQCKPRKYKLHYRGRGR